jgi:hypothetical protein
MLQDAQYVPPVSLARISYFRSDSVELYAVREDLNHMAGDCGEKNGVWCSLKLLGPFTGQHLASVVLR